MQSGCSIVLKTGSVQTAGGSTSSNVPVAEIEGHLIPAENASNNSTGYLIGSNDARWRRLLSYSGVDTSSDVRLKSDITD